MITLNEALKKAIEHFKAVVPDAKHVRIEEIDHDSEAGEWLITVGFSTEYVEVSQDLPGIARRPIYEQQNTVHLERIPRDYRVLQIDQESGDLKKMRMLQL